MSLTLCPNCRLPVNTASESCPLCTAPRATVPTAATRHVPLAAAVALAATFAFMARRRA